MPHLPFSEAQVSSRMGIPSVCGLYGLLKVPLCMKEGSKIPKPGAVRNKSVIPKRSLVCGYCLAKHVCLGNVVMALLFSTVTILTRLLF